MNPTATDIVEAKGAKKYYPIRKGLLSRVSAVVKAVDGVDLAITRGTTMGLVGESGCGKTTLGRILIRLEAPTEGHIYYDGREISNYKKNEIRSLRRGMQIIFQDPYSSLDPRKTVESLVGEPLIIHKMGSKKERREKILQLMQDVGLRPGHLKRYPHEFSGGQRQRIGIARALSLNPKFIICDEPVSALDVSVQAQVINLLRNIQKKYNLSYLFISHDLSVVAHISTQVAVMYLGQIVEIADRNILFEEPLHPYTQALLSALPSLSRDKKNKRMLLKGDVPSPINPPQGCRFHTRCPNAKQTCAYEQPNLTTIKGNHQVRCFDF
jgi:peptide/nickel transport system ATP-binding protein/oligopeptide transport system ATP-binding protein